MRYQIYQGHCVRKRFGQCFLQNQYYINEIVDAINPQCNELLLEIGPGLGALTHKIGDKLNHLAVVEIDKDLALYLKNNPILGPKLIIFQQDILTFDFENFSKKQGNPLRIFGNLPYNISTPLLFELFKHMNVLQDMHLMVQKEVAARLIASPGNKNYGRLSVMAQYYCTITPIITIPPKAFTPSPKVHSTMIRLLPRAQKYDSKFNTTILNSITTAAFSQRRKTLKNSLSNFFSSHHLLSINISPTLRAEDISVDQYCELTSLWLSH
ncbi:16S rRNA (adenine(1518)-N(6)/adenine(1519)-N(6))-dimethyltransferase RsmA [Candidatus Erwinia haradaeae]|uniref:Ribosomal RNA small subunit methyltransferase A n=1 Tax=Candidatus Erwinia haradaeae TaxID=1922217 RepID=A0A803FSV8_9GAMM|nr:16S rRNA (adenine(1518)-N(6)/adenine(1519)-N(6))-dimethyltransferase RsmA [Candidatus Erwinia haradaeae]VFP87276.1 Ribosomal RNA small subunit methyltransferase A [Candidatus Erwinia haradaeae]